MKNFEKYLVIFTLCFSVWVIPFLFTVVIVFFDERLATILLKYWLYGTLFFCLSLMLSLMAYIIIDCVRWLLSS